MIITYNSIEIGDVIEKRFVEKPFDTPHYVITKKGKLYASTKDGTQFYVKNGSIYRKGGGSYKGGNFNGYSYHKISNNG